MCTVLLPPGDNPIAVNKYIIISCAIVMKSVNLNFLEPSGPRQTSNGITIYHLPMTVVLNGTHHLTLQPRNKTPCYVLYVSMPSFLTNPVNLSVTVSTLNP